MEPLQVGREQRRGTVRPHAHTAPATRRPCPGGIPIAVRDLPPARAPVTVPIPRPSHCLRATLTHDSRFCSGQNACGLIVWNADPNNDTARGTNADDDHDDGYSAGNDNADANEDGDDNDRELDRVDN